MTPFEELFPKAQRHLSRRDPHLESRDQASRPLHAVT